MDASNELKIEPTQAGRNGMVTLTARIGNETYTDTVNVTKAKDRAEYVKGLVARWPGLKNEQAAVDRELERIAAESAAPPAAKASVPLSAATPDRKSLLSSMDPAIVAEAIAMLESPNLLAMIVDDIRDMGVAGESKLAMTVYLVGVSRELPRPLAAIVQGPTSSGKTYVIDKTVQLFPAEAVIHATQMTPQALFHMPEGRLVHRFVVAGERSRVEDDDRAEATRALREMLSTGRLTKLMPMKNASNVIETMTLEQKGPIAFIESTTLQKVFDEDANRCLMLVTDETPEQTVRILESIARDAVGNYSATDRQRIVDRHHAMQRLIEPLEVSVPFAMEIAHQFPAERCEARRALPHVLDMIRAVALLHQRQRERDERGRVIASLDDYRVARTLIGEAVSRSVSGSVSKSAQRLFEALQKLPPVFSSADATKAAPSGGRSAVYGWLANLRDVGVIEEMTPKMGSRPATYRIIGSREDFEAGDPMPVLGGESAWTSGHAAQPVEK